MKSPYISPASRVRKQQQVCAPMAGTVAWFDVRRGFGFITPEGGGKDIFVHQSSIIAEGFRSLTVGESVEFVLSEGDDGRARAINVTGPGGACITVRRYFGGVCYRCREVGHMARDCNKRHSDFNSLGHCDNSGSMRHLVLESPDTRFKPPSRDNLLKLDRSDDIRTLSDYLPESTESDEKECRKGTEERNWAELPRDVLFVIFKEIAAVEILSSAQFVCKSWRQLSLEPDVWRCINMTMIKDSFCLVEYPAESLAKLALDRSAGCLEEFYGECFGNGDLLGYMAERAPKMRCLHLLSVSDISDEALVEAIRKFPLLEELWISADMFADEVVELLGRARPQLKVFRLTSRSYYQMDSDSNVDSKAFAIAKHMQQLRRLQLIGNNLSNTGLLAILDGCPYLEHLDIRRCFNVVLDENVMKKCMRIKELRLPNDSITDFMFDPSFCFSEEGIDVISSESDSEYGFQFDDGASDDDDFFYDGFVDYGLLGDRFFDGGRFFDGDGFFNDDF
ncbi:putative F-box/LRR-repeat protein 23 [Platanthera guangdongensis]|uniref:F-box/LRR-repeat protein 23 n=1 Tax=Platanthera guangdongensis TaxID=2320717 RepID=A0ABR2MTA6_9ASPA